MIINEVLDQNNFYKWETRRDSDRTVADFVPDDGRRVSVSILKTKFRGILTWTIWFHRSGATWTIGFGDQYKIFATVLAILVREINRTSERPDYIMFSASEKNRITLYQKMIDRFAAKFLPDYKQVATNFINTMLLPPSIKNNITRKNSYEFRHFVLQRVSDK